MIRAYQPDDIDAVMQLWLTSTIAAHPFIAEQYWHESAPLVRNTYLPAARTWVYLHSKTIGDENPIAGFISILEEQLVGALFVAQPFHGQGIAKALMEHVQQHYRALTLEVYQQNQRAYHFYRKQGFNLIGKAYNAETKSTILTLHWQHLFN
ncbi:TPA: N-acetyltransferase [Yersinia enterocolitica]|uniref:N-acetyltransferase n=1 Tax=Yersinia enterocolitica TaxID=630 RepID=UPI00062439D5|nr:N-acetyltransferase [Yersinia enterocolitica]AKF36169.1 acetyltransferase [Yersinia enterocolitica]ALG47230.1 acetyltransferase [Yersinia enterocolitica]EKN6011021.1 N-acetyltransferase [Yersinia enterocolitica]ELI8014209.1 N-acetyltransferase [Yersinia enterocolitica]HDL7178850.1 N-acetyltransferase [Yersinia enterocolitica]